MGKKSRTKGATAELEVCAILREVFPDVERDLEQTRGHDNGRDLINTGEWCFQVKRRAKMTPGVIEGGYEEAMHTLGTVWAAVIHREDRGQWKTTTDIMSLVQFVTGMPWENPALVQIGELPVLLTMSMDDFVSVLREYAV